MTRTPPDQLAARADLRLDLRIAVLVAHNLEVAKRAYENARVHAGSSTPVADADAQLQELVALSRPQVDRLRDGTAWVTVPTLARLVDTGVVAPTHLNTVLDS